MPLNNYKLTCTIKGIPSEIYIILDPRPYMYGYIERAREIIAEYYSKRNGVELYHNEMDGGYYIVQKK